MATLHNVIARKQFHALKVAKKGHYGNAVLSRLRSAKLMVIPLEHIQAELWL